MFDPWVLVPMPKVLRSLFHEMQAGTVLFFPSFDRQNSAAKVRQLGQFLLNSL
jgi:hypothetical protein